MANRRNPNATPRRSASRYLHRPDARGERFLPFNITPEARNCTHAATAPIKTRQRETHSTGCLALANLRSRGRPEEGVWLQEMAWRRDRWWCQGQWDRMEGRLKNRDSLLPVRCGIGHGPLPHSASSIHRYVQFHWLTACLMLHHQAVTFASRPRKHSAERHSADGSPCSCHCARSHSHKTWFCHMLVRRSRAASTHSDR
jgi:hypothetical protein